MNRLRRWPWPFLLLLFGSVVATGGAVPQVALSPELILFGFLPPLLFDVALSLEGRTAAREWRWIFLLGIAGAMVGAALSFLMLRALRFSWEEALLLAALLAATDPVSVFAALRNSRAPERIRVVLQGESVANDGVAVVLFTLAIGLARGATPDAIDLVGRFLRLSLGGLALGMVLGLVLVLVLRHAGPALSVAGTIVAAYAGYFLAERAGFSGLLCVIAAGVTIGNAPGLPGRQGMSVFWRGAGVTVSGIVFLLMGLQVRIDRLVSTVLPLIALLVVVFLARVAIVAGLTTWSRGAWPFRWQAALVWAGLRGALSLALALSVPAQIPTRSRILLLTLGLVFVSLALQGLSLAPVFRWLNLGSSGIAADGRIWRPR